MCSFFIYNKSMKEVVYMNIMNILNNTEIQDIPILYILRVINVVQKEIINEQSDTICKNLSKFDESIKE